MGTKGRHNVKKPKMTAEKKTQKATEKESRKKK